MKSFTSVTGVAAPLPAENVNTDVIVRIDRLTDSDWDALAPYCFEAWRYRPDGSDDPDFVLNKPEYQAATILIAGKNFACGSSREGAVRALECIGIRSVIAPSFGPIFYNNCFQNGMLPVILPEDTVAAYMALAETNPGAEFTVDLEAKLVTPPPNSLDHGEPAPFDLDEMRRQGLLQGLDEIGLTLTRAAEIDAFQAKDRAERPWIYEL
jgi:3-isopropylmalate/(R)-2-methylmalate dehydratase small subunit